MGSRTARLALLLSSFGAGILGTAGILLAAPGRWWLLVLPAAMWGILFMAWAALTLKDPKYYE